MCNLTDAQVKTRAEYDMHLLSKPSMDSEVHKRFLQLRTDIGRLENQVSELLELVYQETPEYAWSIKEHELRHKKQAANTDAKKCLGKRSFLNPAHMQAQLKGAAVEAKPIVISAAKTAAAKTAAAKRLHVRWHSKRGIVNPDCALCAEGFAGSSD